MSSLDHPPSPPNSRGTIPKPTPGGPSSTANQLMDHLQKQLKDEDTASVSGHSTHSTMSSSGRRRRRRNKSAVAKANNSGLGLGGLNGVGGAHSLLGLDGGSSGLGPMVPKPAARGDGKTPKLKIDLNLDVALELKAQLKGDLCLSLVVEDKYSDRACPEMKMPREGEHVTTELFYMRVGRLRFRRTWIDERAFMRGQFFLTALSAALLLLAGFLLGLSASEYMHGVHSYGQHARGGLAVSSLWVGDIDYGCDCTSDAALGAAGNTTLLH
ncbi:hypothetical protein Daus18300_010077 [Diaporthe australafricana]|uniref:Uncharacterized protein n=1 Tax=Diaporthe australafricana TaxID=127596 RepID=A0ABR3WCL5_9PEZI